MCYASLAVEQDFILGVRIKLAVRMTKYTMPLKRDYIRNQSNISSDRLFGGILREMETELRLAYQLLKMRPMDRPSDR